MLLHMSSQYVCWWLVNTGPPRLVYCFALPLICHIKMKYSMKFLSQDTTSKLAGFPPFRLFCAECQTGKLRILILKSLVWQNQGIKSLSSVCSKSALGNAMRLSDMPSQIKNISLLLKWTLKLLFKIYLFLDYSSKFEIINIPD